MGRLRGSRPIRLVSIYWSYGRLYIQSYPGGNCGLYVGRWGWGEEDGGMLLDGGGGGGENGEIFVKYFFL